MIVGLILAGTFLGVVAASAALILGQSIWMALLIYSGTGVIGVLAGALITVFRAGGASRPGVTPQSSVQSQRG